MLNEATLKRVYVPGKSITKVPENVKYTPMVYTEDEMNRMKNGEGGCCLEVL